MVANALTERPDRGGGNSEGQRLIPFRPSSHGAYTGGVGTLTAGGGGSSGQGGAETLLVAHTLRADGFDASEDGTGRGTPLIPIDLRQASRGEKITNNRAHGSGGAPGHGIGEVGDPAFTVSERGQAIAFSSKDHGADAGEIAPTLRSMGHDGSHANGGGQVAIAFANTAGATNLGISGNGEAPPITTRNGDPGNVMLGMAVRRLTPRECERLQGFPDGWTLVPYRSKPAADGPRYRALGNSMAVNVMRWIGRRIQMVDDVPNG